LPGEPVVEGFDTTIEIGNRIVRMDAP
jgi:hypothetical protein